MSWRDAPLYIEAHDLAGWILERASAWSARGDQALGPLASRGACDLVEAVALALTFPASRAAHLEQADVAIVTLRTRLRLAQHLGLITARGMRFAGERLRVIGRMVGGWRKRVARAARSFTSLESSGDGPPAASV